MSASTVAFQSVAQAARTLGIDRKTVQRRAPTGSKLRNKEGLVDVENLRKKLWIGAPVGAPRKSGYPAGVPREKSGVMSQNVRAERQEARDAKAAKKCRDGDSPFTLDDIVERFVGWKKYTENGNPFEDWDHDRLREIERALMPVIELFAELQFIIREREKRTMGDHHGAANGRASIVPHDVVD